MKGRACALPCSRSGRPAKRSAARVVPPISAQEKVEPWRPGNLQSGKCLTEQRMPTSGATPGKVRIRQENGPCGSGTQTTWRRRRDSNPGYRFWPVCSLSRGVPSTARPRLRETPGLYRRAYRPVKRNVPKFPEKTGSYASFGALSSSNARCSTRTASSRYFSSMTTEILISDVEII